MPTVTSEHKLPHTYKYRTHLRPLRRASLPSTYEDTYLTVMSTLPVLQISAHDTAHLPVLPQHGLLQHHMPINPFSAPRNRKGAPSGVRLPCLLQHRSAVTFSLRFHGLATIHNLVRLMLCRLVLHTLSLFWKQLLRPGRRRRP